MYDALASRSSPQALLNNLMPIGLSNASLSSICVAPVGRWQATPFKSSFYPILFAYTQAGYLSFTLGQVPTDLTRIIYDYRHH
jgi:hypothetical protein